VLSSSIASYTDKVSLWDNSIAAKPVTTAFAAEEYDVDFALARVSVAAAAE